MQIELLAFSIVAFALGIGACWLLFVAPARRRTDAAESRATALEKDVGKERSERESLALEKAAADVSAARVPQIEQLNDELRGRLEETGKRLAETQAVVDAERKSHAARIEELEKMGDQIERKFAVLASDVLGRNSESFLKLVSERFEKHTESAESDLKERQKAIETLVKPIGESLASFESRVNEIEKSREGAYRAITEQVKNLAEGQTGLRSETSRLVQALRQPKTRGRWGEYQLRNVLEMAGMTEHVDFIEEQTFEGEDGRLRPDVIVKLPGGKSIIVDAKTPLEGYLAAVDADDEETRSRNLGEHVRHVRQHIRSLASKKYWDALPVTPDFVVMFVPGEAFFAAAIESDPNLFEQAVRDRVLISTPTTFIALIKAIAYGWQQHSLAENTQAVAGLARDLYDRIRMFGGHMEDIGKSLRQAVERYNRGVGTLERRILPTARKFEAMGVSTSGTSISTIEPIELEARSLQASELISSSNDGKVQPQEITGA